MCTTDISHNKIVFVMRDISKTIRKSRQSKEENICFSKSKITWQPLLSYINYKGLFTVEAYL